MAYRPRSLPRYPPRPLRPRRPPPGMGASSSATTTAVTLGAIACLTLVLLLVASTIVLALIPVYLPAKNVPGAVTSVTRYFTLPQSSNIPAYGLTSAATCSTIANAMGATIGISSNAITGVSCSFGSSASGSRRRRLAYLRRLRRQTTSATLFMTATMTIASCPRCSNPRYLNKLIGRQFSSTFDYYGTRSTTFTVARISSNNFGSIATDPITTTVAG